MRELGVRQESFNIYLVDSRVLQLETNERDLLAYRVSLSRVESVKKTAVSGIC